MLEGSYGRDSLVPAVAYTPALIDDGGLEHGDVVAVGGVVVFTGDGRLGAVVWDIVRKGPG